MSSTLLNRLLKLSASSPVIVGVSTHKGRGVFAQSCVKRGGAVYDGEMMPLASWQSSTKIPDHLIESPSSAPPLPPFAKEEYVDVLKLLEDCPRMLQCFSMYTEMHQCATNCTHGCKSLNAAIQNYVASALPRARNGNYDYLIAKLSIRICVEHRQASGRNKKIHLHSRTNGLLMLLTFPESSGEGSFVELFQSSSDVMTSLLGALGLSSEAGMFLDKSWYARIWGVLSLNCIRTPSGLSFFSLPSLLNHSCEPNVGLRFYGSKQPFASHVLIMLTFISFACNLRACFSLSHGCAQYLSVLLYIYLSSLHSSPNRETSRLKKYWT